MWAYLKSRLFLSWESDSIKWYDQSHLEVLSQHQEIPFCPLKNFWAAKSDGGGRTDYELEVRMALGMFGNWEGSVVIGVSARSLGEQRGWQQGNGRRKRCWGGIGCGQRPGKASVKLWRTSKFSGSPFAPSEKEGEWCWYNRMGCSAVVKPAHTVIHLTLGFRGLQKKTRVVC